MASIFIAAAALAFSQAAQAGSVVGRQGSSPARQAMVAVPQLTPGMGAGVAAMPESIPALPASPGLAEVLPRTIDTPSGFAPVLETAAPGAESEASARTPSRDSGAAAAPISQPALERTPMAAVAQAASGRTEAGATQADDESPAPGALGGLQAVARAAAGDGPDAFRRFFDLALTGLRGEAILRDLRARGDAALLSREAAALGQDGSRPAGWGARVENWILGRQALVRRPLVEWLAREASSKAGVDSFREALAKANAALGAHVPRLQENDLYVLTEFEENASAELAAAGVPNLRHVGAYHADGINVYSGLAQQLSAEELVGVGLHEHFARLGFGHGAAVRAMQKATKAAFGRPVLDVDLQSAARRSLGPPAAQAPAGEPPRPAAGARRPAPGGSRLAVLARALPWVVLGALALLGAAGITLLGLWSRPAVVVSALATLAALAWALNTSAAILARGLERRYALSRPARSLEGIRYRFDPRSLSLVGREDGIDVDGDWSYSALVFEDDLGWRVAVVPHAVNAEGDDHALEVQWAWGDLRDRATHGHFFIFSHEEFLDHGEQSGEAVGVSAFEGELLDALRRSVSRYAADPAVSIREARSAAELMDAFEAELRSKEDAPEDGLPPRRRAA